jgi:hypothetical protein
MLRATVCSKSDQRLTGGFMEKPSIAVLGFLGCLWRGSGVWWGLRWRLAVWAGGRL